MRTRQYLLSTLKEIPIDAEVISHQLMLRAGMIRKLASGLYTWLPTGLRVLRNVENIIREEMNNANAIELSMPILQPADLWKESGRWEKYGLELLRFVDRSNRLCMLSPTDEEVITDLIRNEISSYKQLPLNFFQIRTKFRDEVRPRFGIIRSREFIMKDAYSFHISQDSLHETYDLMCQVYKKIFSRIGLEFHTVHADTGSIGGSVSHEFHVLTENGEDDIVFSTNSDYAANIDLAEAIAPLNIRLAAKEKLRMVDTPNFKSIDELVKQRYIPIEKTIKTILVHATEESGYKLVALLIRGDHVLNKVKAEKLMQVFSPLTLATEEEIRDVNSVGSCSLGPIHLQKVAIIADRSVENMSDFAADANIKGKHYLGINWIRDLPLPQVADIRNVMKGDASPDGKGTLLIKRGMEVGHIFKLGTKYTEAMNVAIQSKNGCKELLTMGCYGMGITRVIAAVIEQNHDKRGIIWPSAITPFQVAILPINMSNSLSVRTVADELYNTLLSYKIDVLFDDRQEQPGVMFADIELIGITHCIIISNRTLQNEEVEYKDRRIDKKQMIKTNNIVDFLLEKISH